MRVKKEPLPAIEVLEILDKYWVSTNDIKAIACVGKDKARKIKKEVAHLCELDNMKIPYDLVPADRVAEHLNINIKYLKQCANYTKKDTTCK